MLVPAPCLHADLCNCSGSSVPTCLLMLYGSLLAALRLLMLHAGIALPLLMLCLALWFVLACRLPLSLAAGLAHAALHLLMLLPCLALAHALLQQALPRPCSCSLAAGLASPLFMRRPCPCCLALAHALLLRAFPSTFLACDYSPLYEALKVCFFFVKIALACTSILPSALLYGRGKAPLPWS